MEEHLETDEEAIPGENKCEVIPSGISQAGVQHGFQPEPIRGWGPRVEYLGWGIRCRVPVLPLPLISGISLGNLPLCSSAKWGHEDIRLLEPLEE